MRSSRTQWVVLGLLSHGPMSGYDIRRTVEETTSFFWRESYGQIYPVLDRLARRGLIRRHSPALRGPRQRRTFAITPAGREALAAWLSDPPEPESVRNELLLKTFFSHALPAPRLRSHIEAFLERQQSLADYFAHGSREVAALEASPRKRAWTLTVRAGQLVTDARIRWAREALAALQDEIPPLASRRTNSRRPEQRSTT